MTAPAAAARGPRRPDRAGGAPPPDGIAAQRQLVAMVEQRTPQLVALFAGDEALVERFKTVALHAATANPKILASDPLTVIEAMRDSAAMGLELNGVMGEGYLVPYWNSKRSTYETRFQPGYRGLLKLIRRSGQVLDISSDVVYEGDAFEFETGSDAYVRHRPAWKDRGGRLGTYAYAKLPGGVTRVLILTEAEAEQVRKSSKAADDGPWIEWPDEMRKKTAIRRLAKTLPQDPLVERALEVENRAEQAYAGPPPERRELRGAAAARDLLGAPAPAEAPALTAGERPAPQPTDEPTEATWTADEVAAAVDGEEEAR
jgi:phage RecT family recombinase